jgi:hypothetical protein
MAAAMPTIPIFITFKRAGFKKIRSLLGGIDVWFQLGTALSPEHCRRNATPRAEAARARNAARPGAAILSVPCGL